jgi:hypothetical protein
MQGTQEGAVSAENVGVTAESFTERMRERMPAHSTWRRTTVAPALSRGANDAMWDEMRTRLRTYAVQKEAASREPPWRAVRDLLVQPAGPRSVIAIVTGGLLLLAALFGLVR